MRSQPEAEGGEYRERLSLRRDRLVSRITLDDPHPLANAPQNVQRAIELLACMCSRDDGTHAGFTLRNGREANTRRQQALLEQPAREFVRPPRFPDHDGCYRGLTHAAIESAIGQRL